MRSKPWVAVPADRKQIGPHPFHAVGDKYLRALRDAAGVQALALPAWVEAGELPVAELDELLLGFDGLFLTGSPSNIEPARYAAPVIDPAFSHDPHRDATTLSLLPRALLLGIPVLAVCRGLQEVNVAFGGSLLQKVHEQPGRQDHREDPSAELDVQYAPVHAVDLVEGGLLRRLAGVDRVMVNSLHGQGIDRLGQGLRVEARAADGLIEAVSCEHSDRFLLAVQWHPEWRVLDNPFYHAIFQAFAGACRERLHQRH